MMLRPPDFPYLIPRVLIAKHIFKHKYMHTRTHINTHTERERDPLWKYDWYQRLAKEMTQPDILVVKTITDKLKQSF